MVVVVVIVEVVVLVVVVVVVVVVFLFIHYKSNAKTRQAPRWNLNEIPNLYNEILKKAANQSAACGWPAACGWWETRFWPLYLAHTHALILMQRDYLTTDPFAVASV